METSFAATQTPNSLLPDTHKPWGYGLVVFLICCMASCASSRVIINKPIQYDQARKALSVEYLSDRYGIDEEIPTIDPKIIVLHYTVIPTMQGTYEAFYPPELPDTRPEIRGAGSLNVSSHYLVDRDGTIYRLMPDTLMARHVIGLNHCAIGIENVGGTESLPLTKAQLKADIWLVRQLKEEYPIEYLIGHYEYQRFEGHPLWMEKDTGYRTVKYDPGKKFMEKVRKAFKNGTFKPVPKPQDP